MRTIIVFALALTVAPFVSGDDHDNSWRGVDLDRWFGVQFEVCKLRPGKTMSDVLKLDNEARKQFAANTQGISLLRLAPMFSHAMPGDSAADYLNIVMGSIPDIGASWDKWMASESAQNLMAKSNAVAECTFKFARAKNRVAKIDALDASPNRLMSLEWCAKRDNIQWDQLVERHDAWEAAYADDSPAMAWNIVAPRLGSGERQGHFMHMVSYANATQLMANEEWIANGGGSNAMRGYRDGYASCEDPAIYNATYVYRNE